MCVCVCVEGAGFLAEAGVLVSVGAVSAPAPLQTLGPHVASLGLAVYTGTQFPAVFNGSVFVAERGSWDRAQSIGYRIANVRVLMAFPLDHFGS